jgi:hypothetical protein
MPSSGRKPPISRRGDQEDLLLRLGGFTSILCLALTKPLGPPLLDGLSNAIVELLELLA